MHFRAKNPPKAATVSIINITKPLLTESNTALMTI